MILDGYWKKELLQNKRSLKFWLKLGRIHSAYVEHQINKAILYSSVIIRKMFEDEKGAETEFKKDPKLMPDLELLKHKVAVRVYPFTGDKNFIAPRVAPSNYDYEKTVIEEIELNKLCNQIIHSYIWSVAYEHTPKRKIHSVLFASDLEKTKVLYMLKPKDFIKAIDFCIEKGTI